MAKGNTKSSDPRVLPRSAHRKIRLGLILVPVFYGLFLMLTLGCMVAAGLLGYLTVHIMFKTRVYLIAGFIAVPAISAAMASLTMLRAMLVSFRKPPGFMPAVWINSEREVELAQLVSGVCKDLGIAYPNAVILHADTSFFATRCRMTVLNANPRGTILGLSLPLLSVLTVNELRTVVTHELAHFSGGDVKYRMRVLPVYAAIGETMRILARHDPTNHYGVIARVFVRFPIFILHVFAEQFLRLDLSLSRVVERRADAVSASICGRESFASAMRKTVGYGFAFGETLGPIMEELRKSNQPDSNAYRTFRKRLKEYQPIAQKGLAMQMVDYSDAWEQHPSLIKRIESLPPYAERYNDTRPALALFKQYAGYENIAHRFMFNEYQIYRASMR